MGYWGWRPLIRYLFISVWITSCITTQEIAPATSPTEIPSVTLISRTSGQTSTLSPPGLPIIATITPSIDENNDSEVISPTQPHIRNPTPTYPPLMLPQPTCYQTAHNGILCLGHVENNLSFPIQRVSVIVEIYHANGGLLRRQAVTLEQHMIPVGQSAPYRVVFASEDNYALPDSFGAVITRLIRADKAQNPASYRLPIQIEEEQGQWVDGWYHITATVRALQDISASRAIVTLYDESGRVAGYRILELNAIPADETATIETTIIPQIMDVPLYHTLHLEPY